jgi:unsaturated chondroitin disaccharide hydrolase
LISRWFSEVIVLRKTLVQASENMSWKYETGSSSIPLTRAEMVHALELLIHRMEHIDSSCTDTFPLYSPGTTNRWVSSAGGSWMGGLWSACWWLRARITGSEPERRRAASICKRLSPKITIMSINRSLIFWYGASLGDLWFGDDKARKLSKASIAALADSYDKKMHCIPSGPDMGGGEKGNRIISVDSLAALIQLLGSSKNLAHQQVSRTHASTLLAACGTGEGAFHPYAYFEDGRFHPISQAGAWSRGQAWSMLGLTRAAAQWGEPYLTHAQQACEYWGRSRQELLAPNRLNDFSCPDLSSSVIASLAMLSLADLVADGEQWRAFAHQQLAAVIRSRYFVRIPAQSSHARNRNRPYAIFWGCCYKTHGNKEEMVESAWGNFFMMAALSVLLGILGPGEF